MFQTTNQFPIGIRQTSPALQSIWTLVDIRMFLLRSLAIDTFHLLDTCSRLHSQDSPVVATTTASPKPKDSPRSPRTATATGEIREASFGIFGWNENLHSMNFHKSNQSANS